MGKIRVAVAGVGNCASSLIQGLEYYRVHRNESPIGLMHEVLGGYHVNDIEIVAAFDIDARKVGQPLSEAIFALPNCTQTIQRPVRDNGVIVQMGQILDGIADHMAEYPEAKRFVAAAKPPVDVSAALKASKAEILVNYLPVGSEQAARFYAECALAAGVSFINCIPVFIASDPEFARRFERAGIPIIGDDIKSQVGATIVHRTLISLFEERGMALDRTYQLNTGGNTDFLNMLERRRLKTKKISKTEAVQSALSLRLSDDSVHIGPSDYVPWQGDNKICFLRIEGRGWGNVPIHIEARLSVEDSPNSAGVVVDAIRCCQIARDQGLSGPIEAPSAYFMKHPPRQLPEHVARASIEELLNVVAEQRTGTAG
jgi:myo-inositol-1-phosphate synthase